jgi:class 3 adenylate cyclase
LADPRKRFFELLFSYSKQNDKREFDRIEKVLWAEFGRECTVFVLDMSGFSLLSKKYGVVHYLSMVRRMQVTVQPIVVRHGGTLVKFEADNCFAVFPEPLEAIRAAIEMNGALDVVNRETPEALDIFIACGIDYGRVLMVGDVDFFGDAVNRASKLGEDLASAGDIFVTAEAMKRVPESAALVGEELELSISGLTLRAFSVDYHHR